MSRSRILDRMTRYQWFESGFLQRRVGCELASDLSRSSSLKAADQS
jgi:hypothetical protein